MVEPLTVKDFFRRFPDEEACLAALFRLRYGPQPVCPGCGAAGRFHKLAGRRAWACACGRQLRPTSGTPFARSRVPLQAWLYVLFRISAARAAPAAWPPVSAAALQRELGVTYKTAWRLRRAALAFWPEARGEDPFTTLLARTAGREDGTAGRGDRTAGRREEGGG